VHKYTVLPNPRIKATPSEGKTLLLILDPLQAVIRSLSIGSGTGRSDNITFTVPKIPAGGYTVTLRKVRISLPHHKS